MLIDIPVVSQTPVKCPINTIVVEDSLLEEISKKCNVIPANIIHSFQLKYESVKDRTLPLSNTHDSVVLRQMVSGIETIWEVRYRYYQKELIIEDIVLEDE